MVARKDGACVKLYSQPGNDLTYRFPLVVEALAPLRARSCIIDGEAVACSDDGIASFERIQYRRHDGGVFLFAFDLIELDGEDMRRDPARSAQGDAREPPDHTSPGRRHHTSPGRRPRSIQGNVTFPASTRRRSKTRRRSVRSQFDDCPIAM